MLASSFWPLSTDPNEVFLAGNTLAYWQNIYAELGAIRYPWELLDWNARILSELCQQNEAEPPLPEQQLDGVLLLGEGSKILPGVYVEGFVQIGKDCKIGPNCYLRGSTSIGDRVRIGQAVEIKNSLIANDSAVGHLSYVGDSILAEAVNLGAGTITANLRHDHRAQRSQVAGELLDTGRKKLGAILGKGVHTGIHSSLYPGRKLGPGQSTLPGARVDRDLH